MSGLLVLALLALGFSLVGLVMGYRAMRKAQCLYKDALRRASSLSGGKR